MKIFVKKRKVLKISRGRRLLSKYTLDEQKEYSNMNKLCYLGNIITTDAKFNRETKRRIAIGK